MTLNLNKICNQIIKYSFYLLFFLTPLILTPWNYELFEFNKMLLVYFLTIIITGTWLIKMIQEGKIRIQKTPLDIPILLFFIFNFLSFIFSIDPHVSLWGYYSRFHGGLLSTICYVILYYAFVTNFSLTPSISLISPILLSATLVSLYGIAEHFGIDKNLWVQDVQNRVFSTLGQPNWLAAYLCIVLPITTAFFLSPISLIPMISQKSSNRKGQRKKSAGSLQNFLCSQLASAPKIMERKSFIVSGQRTRKFSWATSALFSTNLSSFLYLLLSLIFYLTLLFTKSRSGFLAFWLTNVIFWFLVFLKSSSRKALIKPLLIFNFSFLIFNFIVGSPFPQLNRYLSFSSLIQKTPPSPSLASQPSQPSLETGGTESGEIRRIVWQGALNIARRFPLFGTGVETFAFAYYRFKPKEHNLTSEWDFLYNKAHNEYLNYAATTGFLGLGSYLFLIGSFLWWNFKKLKTQNSKLLTLNCNFALCTLHFALLAGYASILITNFFGFSVVTVALFFWLIPAISFALLCPLNPLSIKLPRSKLLKNLSVLTILFFIFHFSFFIFKLWYADVLFARGNTLLESGDQTSAYLPLQQAIALRPNEPLYHNTLALNLAHLTTLAFLENEATLSATLLSNTLSHSQKAITISSQNVSFWKGRTRAFYLLSQIDEKYLQQALDSLKVAQKLAPTDAKIAYNLGVLYAENEETEKAIKSLETAVQLKPNYRDARFALALFYQEKGLDKQAQQELKYILEKINPEDQEVKEQLKQ